MAKLTGKQLANQIATAKGFVDHSQDRAVFGVATELAYGISRGQSGLWIDIASIEHEESEEEESEDVFWPMSRQLATAVRKAFISIS
jgi:hypothetical protein